MRKTWVYGKVEPGWYLAMWGVFDEYIKHLRELNYEVIVGSKKPEC